MTKRRELFQQLGAGALLAGLPALAGPLLRAGAQGERPPLRVVFFYDTPSFIERYSHPVRPDGRPWPSAEGQPQTYPGEAPGTWRFGPGWSPLAGLEDRSIFLSGFDFPGRPTPGVVGQRRLNHALHSDGGGHAFNMAMALTCHEIQPGDRAGGPSIDQYIADGLTAQGEWSPLHSVVAGLNANGGNGRGTGSFRPDGSVVPTIADPVSLYDALFPPELVSSDLVEARRQRRARVDVLVRSLSARTAARLPRQQRLRVEAHMQMHVDARTRAAVDIHRDRIPLRAEREDWESGLPDDTYRLDRGATDLNMRSVAAALHAGVTRVAHLRHHWPAPEEWEFVEGFPATGANAEVQGTFGTLDDHTFHHLIAPGGSLEADARANEWGLKLQHVYARRLRRFIDMLADLPEGDGTSLLDNTLVVACSEMANVNHEQTNGHWILIGDAQGAFRTGRSLLLPRTAPDWLRYRDKRSAGDGLVLNGDILAAVSEAMGVDSAGFGHPSLNITPLELA